MKQRNFNILYTILGVGFLIPTVVFNPTFFVSVVFFLFCGFPLTYIQTRGEKK